MKARFIENGTSAGRGSHAPNFVECKTLARVAVVASN